MHERQGFKDLRVWQQAMELVVAVMRITAKLPKYEEYGLTSQIRRSAVSVPSNIAEGWGRNGQKEFARFLDYASGSLCELETQLEIANRIYGLCTEELCSQCGLIRRQILVLNRSINKEPV